MLNIQDLSRPELPRQDNYEQALKIALDIFAGKDPGRTAIKARSELEGKSLIVPHLDKAIVIDLDTQCLTMKQSREDAPIWLAILVLHYLNNASGIQPSGQLKHFREFKDGHFYEPAFNRRTRDILISAFGENPAPMVEAGRKLNGQILQTGDAAVELPYFPCLPVTCIVWKGDEEFPPEATVLFDETADVFFSAEDMAVAGQMAVLELLKASRE